MAYNPSMLRSESGAGRLRIAPLAAYASLVLALAGLYVMSRSHYLLFHSLIEISSISVAMALLFLALNSRSMIEDSSFTLLALGYLVVAGLDLLHTLAYRGMGVFPWVNSSNPATQLWIAARFAEVGSLLAFALALRKPRHWRMGWIGFGTVLSVVFASVAILALGWFPTCYVEGVGLTAFKRFAEYSIVAAISAVAWILWRNGKRLAPVVRRTLMWSLLFTALSELAFTLYTDVYGVFNAVGHLLKLVSFVFVYLGLIRIGFTRPQALMLSDLREERKRRRTAEDRYKLVVEHMKNAIAVYKATEDGNDFVFVEFNRAAEEIEGVLREEVLEKRVTQAFPGVEEFGLLEVLRRVYATGIPEDHPVSFYQDARLRSWRENHVFRLPSGEIAAVYEDVTAGVHAQNDLKKHHDVLRGVMSSVPSLVLLLDEAGERIQDANRSAARFLGITENALRGKELAGVLPEDLASQLRKLMEARLSKEDLLESLDRDSEGNRRWLGWGTFRFRGGTGIIGRDISDLVEAREYARSLFVQAADPMFILDMQGNHVDANPSAAALLGYDRAQLRTAAYMDVSAEPEASKAALHQLAEGDELPPYKRMLVSKEKEAIPVELHLSVLRDLDGTPTRILSIARDIRPRLEAEEKLRQSWEGAITAVGMSIESRDPYTAGHQRKVMQLAVAIAEELELPSETVQAIRVAALLHDIGKIAVPAEILAKPSKLSAAEKLLVNEHVEEGYKILREVQFPWPVADIVRQTHERMDGSGYPAGLAGEQIRLEARIIAIADVVEAIMSHRPYRPALGLDVALDEIGNNKGSLYDGRAVDACITVFTRGGFRFASE